MQKRIVNIKMIFEMDGTGEVKESIELETNDIPKTLILENLKALLSTMAVALVQDIAKDIPEDMREEYFNAQIDLDRSRLKNLLS